MKMGNHPQVNLLLEAMQGVAEETEKIPVEDMPMGNPSALTFAAVWQGFQLAADLWMIDPDLMREIYIRERWDRGSAGLAPQVAAELKRMKRLKGGKS